MKSRYALCIVALTTLFGLAIPAGLAAQGPQSNQLPRYAVIDLGTLGGTSSVAVMINHKGWITGSATLPGDTAFHAFLRQEETNMDLGTLGGTNSLGLGLNVLGLVVGGAESFLSDPLNENFCFFGTGSLCLPFMSQGGAIAPLITLGGTNGIAFDINKRGQIGGVAETSTPDATCAGPELRSEPVIWNNGIIRQLPTVLGDPDGYVMAINNTGQAVGGSGNCWTSSSSSLHAVLWQNDIPKNLGNLGGALYSAANAINEQGNVVGSSDLAGDTNFFAGAFVNAHGFVWQGGATTDLGTLPGDANSFAQSINNLGQIVGIGSRAIVWQNGLAIDLNTLVPGPPFSPLYLLQANEINDRGEIAGLGLASNGETHAFMAIPCDETHADDAACNVVGLAAAMELAQPATATANSMSLVGTNPAFDPRFGRMLHQLRVQGFPSRLGPNWGFRPVN
jgi:probable HAF family extracellular repeat protein